MENVFGKEPFFFFSFFKDTVDLRMTVQRTRTKQQWHGALCAESDLGREVGDDEEEEVGVGVKGHVNRRCGRGRGCTATKLGKNTQQVSIHLTQSDCGPGS